MTVSKPINHLLHVLATWARLDMIAAIAMAVALLIYVTLHSS
jgi:hypothetical protein